METSIHFSKTSPPKKISPKKISPKKFSPQKFSPKQILPKKISPKKNFHPKKIFTQKVFTLKMFTQKIQYNFLLKYSIVRLSFVDLRWAQFYVSLVYIWLQKFTIVILYQARTTFAWQRAETKLIPNIINKSIFLTKQNFGKVILAISNYNF